MKKALLILLLSAITVPQIMAQPGYMNYDRRPSYYPGMLKVSLSDNYPVTVAIDGRYYNRHGSSMTVGGLPPGRHHLKVYAYEATGDGYANAHLLYEGRIHIFENVLTSFVLNENTGEVYINRGDINNGAEMPPAAPEAGNNNNNGDDEQAAAAMNGVHGTGIEPPPAGPAYEPPAYPKISKAALDKLGVKVNAKVTDIDKMQIIKTALKKKAVTTDQLSLMMAWVDFESSRVELLEWAYDHTIDKEHYNRLKEQLTYKSSKEDLDNFLNENK